MRFHFLCCGVTLALSAALPLTCVAADAPYARIISPQDGAKLDAMSQNRIDYEVAPGPGGDHIHLYVDNKEAAILRKLSGSHALESLPPGAHGLCIKVVNKAHVPIGVEHCVKVSVQ
ncbi:MAG: hypothetical protein WC029_02680 [Sulfuricella sp.]|jgi:hypothetical protein